MRELQPGLWRMFVEAGVSTHDVQRLARENGLFFAPDPGASEQSQIGGNVATNAGGPHALKYGVTGSWVAGLQVALAILSKELVFAVDDAVLTLGDWKLPVIGARSVGLSIR